ncbi:MAG: biopolymer transporter ExbD [bacterium]
MARQRRLNGFQAGELNLTAMIDVAFQLLAFFILTAHPVDVMANLNVYRPMAEEGGQGISAIRVTVFPGGYTVNGAAMSLTTLSEKLGRLSRIDKSQTILIQCTSESQHGQLVGFLDVCARLGLTNLSVVSSGGS